MVAANAGSGRGRPIHVGVMEGPRVRMCIVKIVWFTPVGAWASDE